MDDMDAMESSTARLLADEYALSTEDRKGPKKWPSAFVFALTLAAGLSSLLSGYLTGVTSAALVSIGTSLSGRALTSLDKSLIASSESLFAMFASPLASVLADRMGRKRVILYADILYVVASLVQAAASNVALVIVGRCVLGVAAGAAGVANSLYIPEVAPAKHRGMLVTTNILMVTMGQVLGFLVASAFAVWTPDREYWRWTIGFGAVVALLQAVAVVTVMPDTPRWLIMVGRIEAARAAIQKIHGENRHTALETVALVKTIQTEAQELREARQMRLHVKKGNLQWLGPWRELLSKGSYRRALTIACSLMALQQFCGFTSLIYFSTTIFRMVGFKNPSVASLVIASINFIFTVISLRVIDGVGRRRMLLRSLPFMIVGLLSAAIGFSFLPLGALIETKESSNYSSAAGIVLAGIVFFTASFALGLGNVPAMQSELYPLAVRSLGTGVANVVSSISSVVMGLSFLPLMELLSPKWSMTLYAGICTFGYYVIYHIFPETAGLSLEEAAALLEHGWGAR